jgi:NADH:ubiquinone reductase (H+-translocating)
MSHRVVIVGGGFGGLYAAKSLKKAPVEVTLVDRRNFHLFQPLLYQVATGWLSPANISATLRSVLRKQKNTRVLLGEAVDIDVPARRVILSDGALPYDTLIVATGSRHHYFGNDHWEAFAPGLKTVEDATEIRRRIFLAFEAAERHPNEERRRAYLTFVIVGGGPTGVELAGALAEIARDTLRNDFRTIDPAAARILLLEAGERILPTYPPELSAKAEAFLRRQGVTIEAGAAVTDIRADAVVIRRGQAVEKIPCQGLVPGKNPRRCDRREIGSRRAGYRRAGSDARESSRDLRHRRSRQRPAPDRKTAARGRTGGDAAG